MEAVLSAISMIAVLEGALALKTLTEYDTLKGFSNSEPRVQVATAVVAVTFKTVRLTGGWATTEIERCTS